MKRGTLTGFTLSVAAATVITACFSTEFTCEDERSCPRGGSGGLSGGGGRTSGGSAGLLAGEGGMLSQGGAAAGTSGKGGASGNAATGGTGGSFGGASGANEEGGAGAGGTEPCDGDCKGTTPICDASTNTCVECTKNSQCPSDAHVCDTATNTCVECTAPSASACRGATPACDTATNTCVECTATNSTQCTGSTPACDTDANQCVACLTTSDCSSPAASKCARDNTCGACTTNDDCTHLAGTQVCAAGTCVECTAADETACGANSCNPATHQCTMTARGSVGICKPCVGDSECIGGNQTDPDMRCVPMQFQGTARPGGFCLRRAVKTCSRPFTVTGAAVSLSGATSEAYCGVDQDTTRCEAVLDLVSSQECPGGTDAECGCTARDADGNCVEPGAGGLCRLFVGASTTQCTYQCGTVTDCPIGKTCSAGTTYCQ